MQKTTTFLMFDGKAEEAMTFYVSLFKNSRIISINRYGADGPGKEGSVLNATFTLEGQEYMAIDSSEKHNFTFTPSISIFVNCESEEELTALYRKLSEDGKEMMPLDNYGFSKKFGYLISLEFLGN